MKTFSIENDLEVFGIKAKSFPMGIQEAYEKLNSVAPMSLGRMYYGISHSSKDGIVYIAAANEIENNELSKHSLEKFVIKKGAYMYVDVKDFVKNLSAVGNTFQKMITDPRIDPQGACVEWYMNQSDCRCMVRLK